MKKKVFLVIGIIVFVLGIVLVSRLYYGEYLSMEELEQASIDVGIIKVDDNNFEEEVLKSEKPVILEFFSNSCPPCISLMPTMLNIAKNYDEIKVATINTDDSGAFVTKIMYEVDATPTIIVFKDGEVIDTIIGAASENAIMASLKG